MGTMQPAIRIEFEETRLRFWLLHDRWTPEQASLLLVGVDAEAMYRNDREITACVQLGDHWPTAAEDEPKEVRLINQRLRDIESFIRSSGNPSASTTPAEWIRWAQEKQLNVPWLDPHPLSAPSATKANEALTARAEATYLNIVGGLLELLLGRTPSGAPQSVFSSQNAIIEALLAHYPRKSGMAERTLQDKFAAARRSVASD